MILSFSVFSSIQEDTVVHEFATLCLASLSLDFVCKVQIFDNMGLPPLIQLLSSPDPDVNKNSLEIIFNLVQVTQSHQSRGGYRAFQCIQVEVIFFSITSCIVLVLGNFKRFQNSCFICCTVCVKDFKCRIAVHELGGIPPLLELLKSDFPVIQHLALETLQNVTTDKDTRNTFREEQGFEKLMDILNNTVGVCVSVGACMSSSCPLELIKMRRKRYAGLATS